DKFNNELITDFVVANDNTVYISFMHRGISKIDPNGKLTTNNPKKNTLFGIDEVNEAFITYVLNSGKKSEKPVRIEVSTHAANLSTEIKDEYILWAQKHRAFKSMTGNIIAYINYYLIVATKDSIKVQHIPYDMLSVAEDQDGDLWIGCKNAGILVLSKKNSEEYTIRENYLQGITITSIVEDHEGGMWFTSLEKGV